MGFNLDGDDAADVSVGVLEGSGDASGDGLRGGLLGVIGGGEIDAAIDGALNSHDGAGAGEVAFGDDKVGGGEGVW